jgi:hypothetical protein
VPAKVLSLLSLREPPAMKGPERLTPDFGGGQMGFELFGL